MVYDSNDLQKLVRIASLPTAQTQSKRRKRERERERRRRGGGGEKREKREIKIIKQSKSDAHLMLLSLPVISH